jgi:hypothetical protein
VIAVGGVGCVWGGLVSDRIGRERLVMWAMAATVPAHAVGTALTVQTSLGFLLTTFTIQAVPPVVRAVGWAWAFPMLALGPMVGIWSIRMLGAARRRGLAASG